MQNIEQIETVKNSGRSGIRTRDRPVTCQLCGKAAALTSRAFGAEPVALNLSAINCQTFRRTSKQYQNLIFCNKPRMSEKDIPESIRIGQSKYRHAIPRRWRFIWAGSTMQHHKSQGSHSSA